MKQYVINKADFVHNIQTLKSKAGKARVIAVLKGNGYGLGICEAASVLRENGIDFFAVSDISEGEKLRDGGFNEDILFLTATCEPAEIRRGAELGLIMTAGSEKCLDAISEAAAELNKTVRVHIKADSGFGRFGFLCSEAKTAAEAIKKKSGISVEGAYSHFSFSFSDDKKHTAAQFDAFCAFVKELEENGVEIPFKHICNSCAFLQYEDMYLDGVRIGSALLGRVPLPGDYGLKRIGKMRSCVAEVKLLPKGSNVGYANTFRTKAETKIAVIDVGYKDGYGVEKSRDTFRIIDVLRYMFSDFKSIGKRYTVKIGEGSYRLIGRISMCNIIADVTGSDVKAGDRVELDVNPLFVRAEVEKVYE